MPLQGQLRTRYRYPPAISGQRPHRAMGPICYIFCLPKILLPGKGESPMDYSRLTCIASCNTLPGLKCVFRRAGT